MTPPRPALVCRALLAARDASDGRRRRRKRDTTPDAIGMSLKRRLLAEAIERDPDPDAFDTWLLERCLARAAAVSMGAMRAMARDVLEEWRVGAAPGDLPPWLGAGAPPEDRRVRGARSFARGAAPRPTSASPGGGVRRFSSRNAG